MISILQKKHRTTVLTNKQMTGGDFLISACHLFFPVRKASPEKPFLKLRHMERDQWIDIALSGYGLVKDNGTNGKQDTAHKAPEVKESRSYKYDYPHEFKGIAQFKA